ncbi:DUF402 domain-containing protein [Paenibacillus harenae]|uniref:DUF402 domain-containing protein n=1 Tax=Paenibacillus harenae TaxID=306543 RepID=UPI0003FF0F93|nr:DUF402 domain-containing protein [Paenibacillus harenae]
MENRIKLRALKYPDHSHYEWEGELLEQTDDYVAVLCKPGRQLVHHTKNKVFTINNTSLEFFFLKEWCTVAIEIEHGQAASYYCNVAMPSVMNNRDITFVDLDLDLLKGRNEDWKVVDEEEFESNSIKYRYPPELMENAVAALTRLKEKVRRAEFPFNEEALNGLRVNKP